MSEARSLAFFLPAHNEGGNLPSVISKVRLFAASSGMAVSIIVVDDGSTDNTQEVLSQMSDVHIVLHETNGGYGAALRSGLKAGLASGADWIAFCDSDGQFDPRDVSRLFETADKSGADTVLGYREHRADNLKRRLMGRGWHWLSSLLLGYHATDVDCGFKLFRREAVEAIMPTLNGDYAMISPEIVARLQKHGFKLAETAMPHYTRQYGTQTGASLGVVFASLVGIFQMSLAIKKEVSGGHRALHSA